MRKIKFRGKRTDTGQWVYGYYVFQRARGGIHGQQMTADDLDRHLICSSNSRTSYEVYPTTIGQFTGLKDKNGVDIYEGDIARAWSQGTIATGKVERRVDGLWIMYPAYQYKQFWGLCPNHCGETSVEVIGNIHEGVTE